MLPYPFSSPGEPPKTATAAPPAIPFDVLVMAAEHKDCADNYEKVLNTISEPDARELFTALVFLATRSNTVVSSN